MNKLAEFSKALAGFIGPGVALLAVALTEQSPGGTTITQSEWIAAAAACVVGAVTVYAAPKNSEPTS